MNIILDKLNETYKLGLEKYEAEIVILSLATSIAFLGLGVYEYLRLLDQRRI